MTMKITLRTLLVVAAVLVLPAVSFAQTPEQAAQQIEAAKNNIEAMKASPGQAEGLDTDDKPLFNPEEYISLVFTHWEHVAIQDAKRSRGLVRPPTEAELTRDLKTREDELERIKPPPEKREIRLAGIVYRKGGDWTIWLNEQRVTPDAIPEEVLDLKVYKTYIELKWFDDYTNQIFPIRLRPHQRFNIDTRIFLPG